MLSLHPDVQDELRSELVEAQVASEDFSYDALMALPLLDAVVRESFRL